MQSQTRIHTVCLAGVDRIQPEVTTNRLPENFARLRAADPVVPLPYSTAIDNQCTRHSLHESIAIRTMMDLWHNTHSNVRPATSAVAQLDHTHPMQTIWRQSMHAPAARAGDSFITSTAYTTVGQSTTQLLCFFYSSSTCSIPCTACEVSCSNLALPSATLYRN